MSAFNVKSTVLANRDGAPNKITDPFLNQQKMCEALGVQASNNGGSDLTTAGGTIRLITVPSNCRIASLDYAVANVGLGTSAIDIAVWYPTYIPAGAGVATSLAGTLISSSAFKANIAGVDTGIEWTDGLGAISANTLPKRSQQLWQALGLTADPMVDLDLGFTVRTAPALNAYVGLRARFVGE